MLKSSQVSGPATTAHTPQSTYVNEYLQCVLFFALLFLVLSVASFDPQDATLFQKVSHSLSVSSSLPGKEKMIPFGNLFGPWGATVADWSWQVAGLGALVFSFVFLAQVLSSFQKPRLPSRFWMRTLGYPQLVLCYLGLLSILRPHLQFGDFVFSSGGWIGTQVAQNLIQVLGVGGAATALTFGMLASLPLCLGIRPVGLVLQAIDLFPLKKLQAWVERINERDSLDVGASTAKPTPAAAVDVCSPSSQPTAWTAPSEGRSLEPEKSGAGLLPLTAALPNEKTEFPREFSIGKIESYSKAVLPSLNGHEDGRPRVVQAADFQSLVGLLQPHKVVGKSNPDAEASRLYAEASQLEEKMGQFGVTGKVLRSQPGPVVNVHEFEPAAGIKVTKVLSLQDDLALGLKAQSVLMAPQPGKSTIGIEVPATIRETVCLRDIMESPMFQGNGAPLPMAIGKSVDGSPLVADLASMPHLLIAGSTGSGKSVGINVTLLSLMMSRTPKQLRLILVDPKMLELSNYDGIGHLLMPVVTEPTKAAGALRWALDEMERRYRLMKNAAVRNIAGFNAEVEAGRVGVDPETGIHVSTLPYVVVVIDELCDLMMTAPKDVEDSIQRLAQKARAAGIHLVLATQRPSVDVLTGVIKANLPCRISFQVASKHDSRTIIETVGAEKLLGKGDMLFLPPGTSKLLRAHGAFVADKEINAIADKLRTLYPAQYETAIIDEVERAAGLIGSKGDKETKQEGSMDGNAMDENALYEKALEFAVMTGAVSTSSIQRHFRIGYNRAARLMDRMDREGLVGPSDVAGKPRTVLAAARDRLA
jgi:DNA segregation ATPase FtsK/SpoIIIE, S-DNA-T family